MGRYRGQPRAWKFHQSRKLFKKTLSQRVPSTIINFNTEFPTEVNPNDHLIDPDKAMHDLMKKETGKLEKIHKLIEKLAKMHEPLGQWVDSSVIVRRAQQFDFLCLSLRYLCASHCSFDFWCWFLIDNRQYKVGFRDTVLSLVVFSKFQNWQYR